MTRPKRLRPSDTGWALRELNSGVSPDEVIGAVADAFALTRSDLLGSGRSAGAALARHVAAYLIRDLCCASYTDIGLALNRDRSSVIAGIRKVTRLVATDERVAGIAQRLRGELTAMARAAE
jgi:chromosomal replication initiation ATPase DnaA